MAKSRGNAAPARNAAVFGGVAVVWLAADIITKRWADTVPVGAPLGDGIPGLLSFRLVHNTGAAWGMLGESTFALGVFALAFCVLLLLAAHVRRSRATAFEMAGYGLVLAGGIGNALDRLMRGYVVDFIKATFIDFPVFNVADIGITCGFVIIVAFILLLDRDSGEPSPGKED